MSTLAEILDQKRTEIAGLDLRCLRTEAEACPWPRDFLGAVSHRQGKPPCPKLIAELKRASPSKGKIAPTLDLAGVAEVYAQNGAAALSVLTDEKFFMGSLETLKELRFKRKMPIPLLRKDFIISEAQVYETRASGADAMLLIVAALPDQGQLQALHRLARQLRLAPLVEVHSASEVERALRLDGIQLIGINNRDLRTFAVSLHTTERLRPMIPHEITVVAESGLSSQGDVERMANAGVNAVLIGEALVTAGDIPAKVRQLAGYPQEAPKMMELNS